MKLCSIVLVLASLALVSGNQVSSSSLLDGGEKMAIARTFAAKDAANLAPSFEPWKEVAPCLGNPTYTVDLVLVFSGSLENSTMAMDAMNEVTVMFEETNGFGNCFDQLLGFGCNIEPHDDIYQPMEASSNPFWVNGPNRQFERTVRKMQEANYSYFGLMEMDSVPVRELWLDALVDEIESQAKDFAILGSTYRGYKWDAFYSELPVSLRMHMNGNAIYNPRHPILERLVTTLEEEAGTAGNTVAFDYRMAQIIHESKTGEKAAFPYGAGLDRPPTYTNLFSDMDVEWPNVVRETPLIANFAGTNVVPQYLGEDIVIAHGANLFERWDYTAMGNISLIVSDWNPSNVNVLLRSLEASSHPFAEIVVVVSEDSHAASSNIIGNTPIRFVPRNGNFDSMDICTAPLTTRWAMKTNSYFQLRQSVPLLVHEGKPVVTFSKPTNETCFGYKTCVEDLKHAKMVSNDANRVFDDLDMVYNVESKERYCSYVATSGHERPSATEYVSFVELMDPTESMYVYSERGIGGLLSPFLRLSNLQVPDGLKRTYRRRLQESTNFTGVSAGSDRSCTGSATEPECISNGCQWNDDLKTCRSSPDLLTGRQSTAQEPSRPAWFTALLVIAIFAGSVALLALMYMGAKRVSQAEPVDSVQPVDGSGHQHDDEIDSSLLFGSEFDFSNILGASYGDMDLNDGHFSETSGGVEYVHD